jgi:hypothetical protein
MHGHHVETMPGSSIDETRRLQVEDCIQTRTCHDEVPQQYRISLLKIFAKYSFVG